MKRLTCLLAIIVAELPWTASAADGPKITVSKETTFVTGPLNKDGTIDFAGAINKIYGKGVTAKNNANVLFWQAVGPHPEKAKMPATFFQLMGMKQPPEKGDYLISIYEFLQQKYGRALTDKQRTRIYDQQGDAARRPWSATQFSAIAAWVNANEKPLELVIAASKRKKYFSPLVVASEGKESYGLIGALLPAIQKSRTAARLLSARAMLNLKSGRVDAAWDDLIASQRLGRLIGSGPTLIEGLVGIAICGVANSSTVSLLQDAQLTARQIKRFRRDLQQLAPVPDMAGKIKIGERFMTLDATILVAKGGPKMFGTMMALGGSGAGNLPPGFAFDKVEWNAVLKLENHWYDRMVAAVEIVDSVKRHRAIAVVNGDIKKLVADVKKQLLATGGRGSKDAVSKMMGQMLIALLVPAVLQAQTAEDRAEQYDRNLNIALALAAYRKDNGRYPRQLTDLTPKYLAKNPSDVFGGKPLKYRPAPNGFLLYSVGQNEKDNGGNTFRDRDPGDDLRIQIPRRKQSR